MGLVKLFAKAPTVMSERTFLQFRVAGSVYGLPVACVVEIIRIVECQPVPNPAPDLIGMINLRGRVIPVYDLGRSLGLGERPMSLRMYVIIAEVEGEALGVLVDDVVDVVTVADAEFQVSRVLAGADSFAAGVARVGPDLLTVLNLGPLIDRAYVAPSGDEP